MKRFDLTFKGDILPDFDPDAVRAGFAELFRINDPLVIEELFSGDSFVLRSNLDRKAAADYFRKIAQLGGRALLITRELSEQQVPHQDLASELFTRIPHDNDADSSPRPQSSQPSIDYHEPVNEAIATDPVAAVIPESTADAAADEPSASEVLKRLKRLQRDAEAEHQSKLDQLKVLQTEVKQETSAALGQIKQRREQTLIESQDELTRLQDLESNAHSQHESDLAGLVSEEKTQSKGLQKALKDLEKQHLDNREEAVISIEQLEREKENCALEAAATIAELESRIASIREQSEHQIDELEQSCRRLFR